MLAGVVTKQCQKCDMVKIAKKNPHRSGGFSVVV
jgi:hypothetical protein